MNEIHLAEARADISNGNEPYHLRKYEGSCYYTGV